MSIKQDSCVPRTPLDVERRYNKVPSDIEYLKELIKLIEVDDSLSTSSINPVQNRVITNALNTKVTKVAGKDLSTNDFTDSYKTKIDNIVPTSNDFTDEYKQKLDDMNEFTDEYKQKLDNMNDFTDAEKTKLSNIEANAEVNVLEKIFVAGEEQTITNKGVNLYVDNYMSDYSENPVQNKVIKEYIDSHASSGGGGSAIYQEYHTDYAGYVWFADGFLVQWGRTSITPTAINTDTTARITYTYSYDSIPDRKTEVSSATPTVAKVTSGGGTTTALSKQGMNIYVNSSTTKAVTVDWKATGYKSI